MLKKIIISIFLFNCFCCANAEILKANAEYTSASAKIEAFKNIQEKIEKSQYKEYLKDPNYKENRTLIEKEEFIVKNKRTLCPFYFKATLVSYAVTYNENPLKTYYYNAFGSLVRFDIANDFNYPRKIYGYSRFGNLISVVFEINDDEQFVYDENGKLLAHWQGNEVKNKKDKNFKFLKLKRGSIKN